MELQIKNSPELEEWMRERMQLNHDMTAIKGVAPSGATYSDGVLIVHTVNVGWRDNVTGEVFHIAYKQ